jgi:hypothetical protein
LLGLDASSLDLLGLARLLLLEPLALSFFDLGLDTSEFSLGQTLRLLQGQALAFGFSLDFGGDASDFAGLLLLAENLGLGFRLLLLGLTSRLREGQPLLLGLGLGLTLKYGGGLGLLLRASRLLRLAPLVLGLLLRNPLVLGNSIRLAPRASPSFLVLALPSFLPPAHLFRLFELRLERGGLLRRLEPSDGVSLLLLSFLVLGLELLARSLLVGGMLGCGSLSGVVGGLVYGDTLRLGLVVSQALGLIRGGTCHLSHLHPLHITFGCCALLRSRTLRLGMLVHGLLAGRALDLGLVVRQTLRFGSGCRFLPLALDLHLLRPLALSLLLLLKLKQAARTLCSCCLFVLLRYHSRLSIELEVECFTDLFREIMIAAMNRTIRLVVETGTFRRHAMVVTRMVVKARNSSRKVGNGCV